MKHLKRIFEDENKFKNTDEEIIMFFTDYYDEGNFSIENVLLFDNKEVVKVTPYLKKPSKYRKAKLVKIKVDKPKGPLHNMSNFSTSLETLQNILADLERFYDMSGEEVNYKIITDFSGVHIQFLVAGESPTEDDSKVKIIDDLLKEFKDIFKEIGFRPSLRGNLVEIRTSAKKGRSIYGDYSVDLRRIMYKISNGEDLDDRFIIWLSVDKLTEWYNKVQDNGLNISLSGGDHQFMIKLK